MTYYVKIDKETGAKITGPERRDGPPENPEDKPHKWVPVVKANAPTVTDIQKLVPSEGTNDARTEWVQGYTAVEMSTAEKAFAVSGERERREQEGFILTTESVEGIRLRCDPRSVALIHGMGRRSTFPIQFVTADGEFVSIPDATDRDAVIQEIVDFVADLLQSSRDLIAETPSDFKADKHWP